MYFVDVFESIFDMWIIDLYKIVMLQCHVYFKNGIAEHVCFTYLLLKWKLVFLDLYIKK